MKTLMRYPGAKTKLLPQIFPFIEASLKDRKIFCDAFVGGGSVALHIAEKYPEIKLHLNDKDSYVFAFWKILAANNKDDLSILKEMVSVQPTIELYYKLRKEEPKNLIEAAYRAIFFNRCSFSGDMRRSASPIGGKAQLSKYKVDCRYNVQKLLQKIDEISNLLAGRTEVSNEDINSLDNYENICTYYDPPYVKMGAQLYQEHMNYVEHKKLSETLKEQKNWVLSYDNHPDVLDLYSWADIHFIDATYCIRGTKSNWHKTKEVLILPKS